MHIDEIKFERKGYENIALKNYKNAIEDFKKIAQLNPISIAAIRGFLNVFKIHPEDWIYLEIKDFIDNLVVFQKKNGKAPSDYEGLITSINLYVMRILLSHKKHPLNNIFEISNKRKIGAKKFVILTCLWKREKVSDLVLDYYSKLKNNLKRTCDIDLDLIAVGSEGESSERIVKNYGFKYFEYQNKPVSKKWQYGVSQLRNLNFDGMIIVGSDDLIDERVIRRYVQALDDGYLFSGFEDAFVYEPIGDDFIYWPGYGDITSAMPKRILETVGLGRMLSRELLEMLDFTIWGDKEANSSLDGIMHKRLTEELRLLPIKRTKNEVLFNGFKIGLLCENMRSTKVMGVGLKAGENITPAEKFKSIKGIEYPKGDELIYFRDEILNFCNREKINKISAFDVSVIIVADKYTEFLQESIKSAINQKFSGNYEVILVSDSNNNLIEYAEKFGIKLAVSEENEKNNSCAKNLNDAVLMAKGEYIQILMSYDFLPENSLQILYNEAVESNAKLIYANGYEYYSDDKVIKIKSKDIEFSIESLLEKNISRGGAFLFSKMAYVYAGGFDENLEYAEDYSLYFKFLSKGLKYSYVDDFAYYYRNCADKNKASFITVEDKATKRSFIESIKKKYVSEKLNNKNNQNLEGDIVFGVASIESRSSSLVDVIGSIYNQADKIFIYQNGYKRNDLVNDPLNKITYISSLETGVDKGDAGKFYFLKNLSDCFYFSIDDDLVYPPNYVDKIISKIKNSNRPLIVSCGGGIFKPNAKKWFEDVWINFGCLECESEDVLLHFGSTGAMAFHTSYFRPAFDLFEKENMADAWIGLEANRQGIPIIGIAHPYGWIKLTSDFHVSNDKKMISSEGSINHDSCFQNIILGKYFQSSFGANAAL